MSLFSPIQLYATLIALAVAGGYVLYSKYQLNSVKTELAAKEGELTQTKANLKVVENANEVNVATIAQLENDKVLLDQVVADMQRKASMDRKTINTLFNTISTFKDDPTSRMPLSPVLKATVEQIQAERAKRASEVR